jgi:hypothetical protein
MKTGNWTKYEVITPSEAIREFIRSYSVNMNSSLQVIVNVIEQARTSNTEKKELACLQQATDTVNNMKAGLELMRKNILCVQARNKNSKP